MGKGQRGHDRRLAASSKGELAPYWVVLTPAGFILCTCVPTASTGSSQVQFSMLKHGNELFEAAEALVLLNTNPPAAQTAPTLVWKGANRSLNARAAKNNGP